MLHLLISRYTCMLYLHATYNAAVYIFQSTCSQLTLLFDMETWLSIMKLRYVFVIGVQVR